MKYLHVTDVNTDLRVNLDRAVKAKQEAGTYTDACSAYAIRKLGLLPWMHYREMSRYGGDEMRLSKVFAHKEAAR